MITPEQIRKKARRKTPTVIREMLNGENPFPWHVRFKTPKEKEMTWKEADHWIRDLLSNSKEKCGYGYEVEFKLRQFHGKNQIPEHIIFQNANDLFRYAGLQKEAHRAQMAFNLLTSEFPKLKEWAICNSKTLIQQHDEWPHIISIIKSLLDNPQPNCFRREFTAAPHSKYLEDHEKLLAQLLEIVLPTDAWNPDEPNFPERFGFKEALTTIWIRFLDKTFLPEGLTAEWIALPIKELGTIPLPNKLFIIENRAPLLSLPCYKDTLGIWGEGFGLASYAGQTWMKKRPIYYWGDLDSHGFSILNNLRQHYPQTISVAMDTETFERFRPLALKTNITMPGNLCFLNEEEQHLYQYLRRENLRLEHERIPHAYMLKLLSDIGFIST